MQIKNLQQGCIKDRIIKVALRRKVWEKDMNEAGKKNMKESQNKTNKRQKQKSIRNKLLKNSIGIISLYLVMLGIISSYLSFSSTQESLEQSMTEIVKVAAESITHDLETYEKLANELSYNPVFYSKLSREELAAQCETIAERNGVESVAFADAEGYCSAADISVSDQEYFKVPKSTGKTYISDLIIRRDNGKMNIMVSAPVMKNNTFQGIVFIGLDASFLCDLVSDIQIGETGNASMINSKGDTIGYSDEQLVLDAYNTQDEVKNDSSLEQLAAVERRVMAGETGFDSYHYNGQRKYVAFTPVEGTNGWGLYVAVEKSEFLGRTNFGILIIAGLILIAVISSYALMSKMAASIVKPIQLCVDRMKKLAEGDIQSEVPEITTGDETQILAESSKILIYNIRQVIGDIDYCLMEMAKGNFAINSKAEESYVGDFQNIYHSIKELNLTLNDTLNQIVEVAGQVGLGAEQMSQNAQDLAEGATDQAGSVEKLTATIASVARAAIESAKDSLEAYENAKQSAESAEESSQEIKKLLEAMERISETSKEIEKIIGAIEDIATQTNLLSLNASIEAARAGEAGRGFAVVADQIGKLASDSAQSAVNTRELIGKSLEEIEKGNTITLKTADVLKDVIDGMKEFAQVANKSSEESNVQADSMREVENGIEQISGVVQSNSAAAEEASATSEELFAQSENLNTLVKKFKLK